MSTPRTEISLDIGLRCLRDRILQPGPTTELASVRFWGDYDMLCNVAEFMHGSCCLAPACLINRTSCAAFSRKLYRHIRLQINNSFLRRVGLLLKSSGVQTIQAISITRYPLYIAHANIIADIFSLEVKQAIVHLVRSAPRLRAFSLDWPNRHWLTTTFFNGLIHTLGSEGRGPLTCLHLNLGLELGKIPRPLENSTLKNFSLRSLCIENMPLLDSLAGWSWAELVLGLLRSSPRLEYLKLSANIDRIHHDVVRTLFRDLCVEYRQHRGQRLELKVLNLGDGILMIPDFKRTALGGPLYLRFLTNPAFLEELHLSNIPQAQHQLIPLAWAIISPWNTPRLRRLYIRYLDYVGFSYLAAAYETGLMSDFIRQLHIHVDRVGYFERSPNTPLPIGKVVATQLDPADLFSSCRQPIRPSGLGIGFMGMGSAAVPLLPRPWAHLRYLTVTVSDFQLFGLGRLCAEYTQSLEGLFVRVIIQGPLTTPTTMRLRVEHCIRVISTHCPRLRYVKFLCYCTYWSDVDRHIWKNARNGCRHTCVRSTCCGVMCRLDYCTDIDEQPDAFWSEPRKMLYLADRSL